jgi:hypothetical protein
MKPKVYSFIAKLLYWPFTGSGKSNLIVRLADWFSCEAIYLNAKEKLNDCE